MTDILAVVAAAAGGGFIGASAALYYANFLWRKSRGPMPAPAAPWYDVPAILRKAPAHE